MRARPPIRRSNATSLASSATALVALVAITATMSSLPGANLRSALLESRAVPAEAPTVRQVAAAVAAAARDLVAGERVTAAVAADHFMALMAAPLLPVSIGPDSGDDVGAPPLHERLIDLPPPVC